MPGVGAVHGVVAEHHHEIGPGALEAGPAAIDHAAVGGPPHWPLFCSGAISPKSKECIRQRAECTPPRRPLHLAVSSAG